MEENTASGCSMLARVQLQSNSHLSITSPMREVWFHYRANTEKNKPLITRQYILKHFPSLIPQQFTSHCKFLFIKQWHVLLLFIVPLNVTEKLQRSSSWRPFFVPALPLTVRLLPLIRKKKLFPHRKLHHISSYICLRWAQHITRITLRAENTFWPIRVKNLFWANLFNTQSHLCYSSASTRPCF